MSVSDPKRAVFAITVLAALGFVGWYSLRIGYARTLDRLALYAASPELADDAAAISPADAEVHETRGEILGQSGNHSAAVAAIERAVSLRPRYYYLWVELGLARDIDGDEEGALRALRHAVALAPAYANVHWQLGNLLLRMGRLDEAFAELRLAASRNPTLLPNVYDLAWSVYRPDATAVAAAIDPRTDREHVALAIVFAIHGDHAAAVKEFLLSDSPDKIEGQKLIGLLLDAKAFSEAYPVWAKPHGVPLRSAEGAVVVHDGGFEEPLVLGERGFGWQITPGLLNVVMSIDDGIHQSGSRSLRIEFRGNSSPRVALLTQTLLVQPQSHYRLSFFVRGQKLISAALPLVTVNDASNPGNPVLVQSIPVRADSETWLEVTMELTTGAKTQAIVVAITRQACPDDPCPAFGTVWFDSLRLAQTGAAQSFAGPKKIDASGRS